MSNYIVVTNRKFYKIKILLIYMKIKDSYVRIKDSVKNSVGYKKMTYDYTMEDIVGSEKFERMQNSKAYKFVSDWTGLAINKVVLGVYMDSKAGLLPGTSALARAISLGVHSLTSPGFTVTRNFVYKKGNVTSDKSKFVLYPTTILIF